MMFYASWLHYYLWLLSVLSQELFFTNFKKLDKIYGSSSSNNFYIIRKLISGSTILLFEFSTFIYNFNHS